MTRYLEMFQSPRLGDIHKTLGININTFIERLPIPTFLWWRTNNQTRLFHCNEAALVLSGNSIDALAGKPVEDILAIHPQRVDDINRSFAQRHSVTRKTARTISPTAEKVTFQNTFVPYFGEFVIECVEEKTSLLYSATLMQARDDRFRELADSLPVSIFEIDPNGVLTFLNQRAIDAFNYCSDQIGQHHWSDMLAPQDRERASDNVKALIQGKNVGQHVYRVALSDGKRFDGIFFFSAFYRNKRLMGFRGFVLDISDYLNKQRQLQQSNDYLKNQVVQLNRELSKTINDLKANQAVLQKCQQKMALMHQELSESNSTMAALARNLDRNRKSCNRDVALTISSKILPLVENLRSATGNQEYRATLDTLELCLKELTQPLQESERISLRLSATEMKIAAMIKNGMTSARIAKTLFVSCDTVKTHRRSIRRKMGLKNARINLKNYLALKLGEAISY